MTLIHNCIYYKAVCLHYFRFNKYKDSECGCMGKVKWPSVCLSTNGIGGLHPAGWGFLQAETQWKKTTVAPPYVKWNSECFPIFSFYIALAHIFFKSCIKLYFSLKNCKIMNCFVLSIILGSLIWIIKPCMSSVFSKIYDKLHVHKFVWKTFKIKCTIFEYLF